MSILIQGMEMPKHGDVLVVREYNGKTYIKHEGHLGFEATLSQIPTPHGRLIDADELANKTFYSKTSAPYITYRTFCDAPTVIERSET